MAATTTSSTTHNGCTIPGNSTCMKALSYVPVLGTIVTLIQELSIRNKLVACTAESDRPLVMQLIRVKNHYKIASIVRNLVTMIATITAIACGIFKNHKIFLLIIAIGYIGLAGLHACALSKNKEVLHNLQSGKPGPFRFY